MEMSDLRGNVMNQIHQGHHHHVVGAVHELVVIADDPDRLREAIRHELEDCNAHRLVIDLTGLEEISIDLLHAIAETSTPKQSRVRFEHGRPTVPIGELQSDD